MERVSFDMRKVRDTARSALGYPDLKPEQFIVMETFVIKGRNVLVVLLTG